MVLLLIVFVLAAIGHSVLWVTLVNRSHGLGISRRRVNVLTLFCVAAFALIPLAVASAFQIASTRQTLIASAVGIVAWGYVATCVAICIGSIIQRWYWSRHPERSSALVANHTARVRSPADPAALAAPGIPTLLARLPGNQVFDVRTQEKELVVPRLATAHNGLRIAHVTDLHMSGRIARAFFEHVVDEVNGASADIVALTGDIIEGDEFLDWIPATLGRLRAQYGVYYVLGNHDRRATESRLKAALADAGLIHVGGRWRQLMVNDSRLVLAGNELPWYSPAADLSDCPPRDWSGGPTRILLAHSPDQFSWAQANDIDLMLAGHLHGGQVRLPILGAILAPSLFGVRYAAGTFTAADTTLHVSRGISALTPLRYGCPPEIAVLSLRTASGSIERRARAAADEAASAAR
jgi:predicted MPP superfamily phosphohydrolase